MQTETIQGQEGAACKAILLCITSLRLRAADLKKSLLTSLFLREGQIPSLEKRGEGRFVGNEMTGTGLLPYIARSKRGFTLIEVLVVVFILGILAALVAPKMLGRTDDAKIAETKLQMKNLETALKLYKLDNGFYPTTDQGLDALVTKPTSEPVPKKYKEEGYLEKTKIPKDAWGNSFVYLSPGTHGDLDIISYASDGKPGGEGKDADIKSWELE